MRESMRFIFGLILASCLAFEVNAQTVHLNAATAPVGEDINLTAGNASSTTTAGGDVSVIAGDGGSTSGNGGNVNVDAGNAGAGAAPGGDVSISAGDGGNTSGNGGGVSVSAGGTSSGNGGGITIDAGSGTNLHNGGDIDLSAGVSDESGARAGIQIKGGVGNIGNGGDLNIFAGNGGVSTGDGGTLDLRAGDAGGVFDAGNVQLNPGAAGGSGVAGKIILNGPITVPVVGSDSGHTTSTLCQDTTSHIVYRGSGTVGICLGTSSVRFKTNVASLDVGLKQIMALQPISYHLDAAHGDPNKTLYGFSAEQGGTVIPELMVKDAEGRPNTFDYLGVVPVLVKAVQELQAEVDRLKKQK